MTILLLMGGAGIRLLAQDDVPTKTRVDRRSDYIFPSKEMQKLMSFVALDSTVMPAAFRQTTDNRIEDPSASLTSFFDKLGKMSRPVRIVHIGDSHVRGHVFPYVMRKLLEDDFGSEAVANYKVDYGTTGLASETGKPGIVYHIVGVNGATCKSYNTPERIAEIVRLKPDLIISSFGTNEAHGRGYRKDDHRMQMEALLRNLQHQCPEASILMTTPPGAYVRYGRRRIINQRTPLVVEEERKFSNEHHLAFWNMYEIVGGEKHACTNWTAAKMFQRDKIHFTAEGYKLMGLLLHEAFIKAYNNYVASTID